MGETRDHLDEHGGPGMFMCHVAGVFVAERCKHCTHERGGGLPDHEEACPPWEPDED